MATLLTAAPNAALKIDSFLTRATLTATPICINTPNPYTAKYILTIKPNHITKSNMTSPQTIQHKNKISITQ